MFSIKRDGKAKQTLKWTRLGILAVLGLGASIFMFGHPAYAQTSTSTSMDMTPLIAIIVSIIPLFILMSFIDKIGGKFK